MFTLLVIVNHATTGHECHLVRFDAAVLIIGRYWSSTSTSYNAYQVEFNGNKISSKLNSSSISERQYGCSVRLVKDVE